MVAVVESSAYVIELLTELAFGQHVACCLTVLLVCPPSSPSPPYPLPVPASACQQNCAEIAQRTRSSCHSHWPEGIWSRTLFYALHALRSKVLIGSTHRTQATGHRTQNREQRFVLRQRLVIKMQQATLQAAAASVATVGVQQHETNFTCCSSRSSSNSSSSSFFSSPAADLSANSFIKFPHIESTQNNCFLNGFLCDMQDATINSRRHLPRLLDKRPRGAAVVVVVAPAVFVFTFFFVCL